MVTAGRSLSRPPRWLLELALLSELGWLLSARWAAQDLSGWSDLARVHAAGEQVPDGSVGTVTLALKRGGWLRSVFEDSRGRRACIELGFSDNGFWLRSQRAEPAPAVHVPWYAMQRCLYFSAWLKHPELQALQLTVQHAGFEERCDRAARGARP